VAAVGAPADGEPEHVLHGAHRTGRHHSLDLLAGIHGDLLIAVVGGRRDPLA
jgi:acetyl-CoA carboxylase carboxyltransferase component